MQEIDTLICAAHVVPVEPRGVMADHAVAVDAGRIVEVLPTAQALERYDARAVVRLDRHALIPGLVNLHCHAAMTLMRGLADEVPLMTWLQERVGPAEAKHVSDEFVHDGSLLAMAEMLRGGVTCVNDMYFFPEATARAALRAGMRAALGVIAIEFPSAYASGAASYLQKGLATRDAYQGEPLLTFCLAPHSPYTVGDEMLKKIAVLAEVLDLPIHCHVHEMATLQGARALGLDADIGSIAAGKAADLAAVELSSVETLPCFDPVSHLVYAAGREHVTHVWVGGEARLVERRLAGLDPQDLHDKARWWAKRLS